MVRKALERGRPRLLREAVLPRLPPSPRSSPRSPTREGPRHPGRLPQPLRRRLPRGQAAARRRRHRHGHPRPGRGLRPGGAASRRAHLAHQRSEGGGCLYDYAAHPLDLAQLVPRRAASGVGGTVLDQRLLGRDRRRGLLDPLLRRAATSVQLSVNWSDESLAQDDDPDHALGHRRPDLRRPPGVQVYLREPRPRPTGYDEGWNVQYTTELTEPVWLLPARRGVQRADRRLRRRGARRPAADGAERLRAAPRSPTAIDRR